MANDDRYQRFNLRIPRELFAQLQQAADAASHSMNAEIVHRLEASLTPVNEILVEGYAKSQQLADLQDKHINVLRTILLMMMRAHKSNDRDLAEVIINGFEHSLLDSFAKIGEDATDLPNLVKKMLSQRILYAKPAPDPADP